MFRDSELGLFARGRVVVGAVGCLGPSRRFRGPEPEARDVGFGALGLYSNSLNSLLPETPTY